MDKYINIYKVQYGSSLSIVNDIDFVVNMGSDNNKPSALQLITKTITVIIKSNSIKRFARKNLSMQIRRCRYAI